MAHRHRPFEPDPDNAGEGTKRRYVLSILFTTQVETTIRKSSKSLDATLDRNPPLSNESSRLFPERSPVLSQPLAQIAIFSALIAVTTGITRVPLPQPIGEITLAPLFYLAISVLFSRKVSFWSIAVGSAVGETISILSSGSPPIFIPGIVWARAPEALIIYKFRNHSIRWIAFAMALATAYETLAFLIPDTLFYAYALFSYSTAPTDLTAAFLLASPDLLTLIDLVFVPFAIGIILYTRRQFRVQFLS